MHLVVMDTFGYIYLRQILQPAAPPNFHWTVPVLCPVL